MRRMVTLQVYVQEGCWSCVESRRIAAKIGPQFPQVIVEVVNLSSGSPPDNIFAVPAYVLDGRLIFLGNPYLDDLHEKLQAALDDQ
jgi:glutaredoxin